MSEGVGAKNLEGGRIRKLVRGNMVTEEIYQLNLSLVEGKLPEKAKEEAAAPAAEAAAAAPAKEEKKKK
jgi:small subunit ribosomal protein S6e